MIAFSELTAALNTRLEDPLSDPHLVRDRELHARVPRAGAAAVTKLLRDEFGYELILMLADDRRADRALYEIHRLYARTADDTFVYLTTDVPADDPAFPSQATLFYPFSRFEREIHDQFGLTPVGNPDTRPFVKHAFWPDDFFPLRKDAVTPDFVDDGTPYPFGQAEGEGVYEIPVGPVHAGVIEPGHFRFNVVGETVLDLNIRLHFTHKGTEKLFEGRTPESGVELAERISGDTSVGHTMAYCQALEALSGTTIPARARYLRVVLLEMERLYNHVSDFGAICNDTGYAIAQAHCARIREQLFRLNKRLTGHRLLRGGLTPGGVTFDVAPDLDLGPTLDAILTDFNEVVDISLNNSMLIDRLEGAGCLTHRTATDYGTLGYIARASGRDLDARRDHPFAAYGDLSFEVPVHTTGDVYARALLRVEEARQAVSLIRQALAALPEGDLRVPLGPLPAYQPAFGIVEAWRGALIHWVMADEMGRLFRVKVKDPSFANWPALSWALLENVVPDFPLCNKSFNLSYSGHDL